MAKRMAEAPKFIDNIGHRVEFYSSFIIRVLPYWHEPFFAVFQLFQTHFAVLLPYFCRAFVGDLFLRLLTRGRSQTPDGFWTISMIRNLPTLPEYAKKIFNSGPFLFFVHPGW